MWARAASLLTVALLAAGGCGMAPMRSDLTDPNAAAADQARAMNPQAADELEQAVAQASRLEYVEAEAKFTRLLPVFQTAGDHERASASMFWLGYCSEKQGRADQAMKHYREVVRSYPKTDAAVQAERRLTILRGAP